MYLSQLKIQHYKSYEQLSLSFSPGINCFVGNNGVGKTNLLDAIFYLSITKSYFNNNDYEVVLFDQPYFTLNGKYVSATGAKEEIHCVYAQDKKKAFSRNQQKYKRISEHIGLIPVVMISPADSNMIVGGSEIRRRFIDVVIAQYSSSYLHSLTRYNKALKNRNILLKRQAKNNHFDKETLSVYEDLMVHEASVIYAQRKAFIDALAPLFNKYYQLLFTGTSEITALQYKSQLHNNSLASLLDGNRAKDQLLQHTSSGIHRDDLIMLLNDNPIKNFGSQGQQKTYLTALKFAKYEYIYAQHKSKPILLLDDVFDKFDAERVEQIIRIVSGKQFGQIFITDTNKDKLDAMLSSITDEHRVFQVTPGKVAML